MNKKSLRFAAWALGLSMAIAGVGVLSVNAAKGNLVDAANSNVNISPADIPDGYTKDTGTSGSFTKTVKTANDLTIAYSGINTKSSATAADHSYGYAMFLKKYGFVYSSTAPSGVFPSNVTVTFSSGTGESGKAGITYGASALSTRNSSVNGSVTRNGTCSLANNDPTKVYWNFSTTGANVQVSSIQAVYTPFFVISFDSQGGSQNPSAMKIKENGTFTFPSPGIKTGYSFLGWAVDNVSTKYAAGATSPTVTAAASYIAQWEENTSPSIALDKDSLTLTRYGASDSGTVHVLTSNIESPTYSWERISGDECVTLSNETTDTVTVTSAGNALSASATVRVTVNGTNGGNPITPLTEDFTVSVNKISTEDHPYSVAEAKQVIDAGGDLTEKYTTGIVSQVDSFNNTHKSITYWISDDGTTTGQMEVYGGKGIDGANFSGITDIKVGDRVVVSGTLKKYNDIYEYDSNNELVTHTAESLSSLVITNQQTIFTQGNTFSLGEALIKANYSIRGEKTIPVNDGGLTFAIKNGAAITTSTVLNHASHDGKTIVVTYTDPSGRSASAEYGITVNYAAVTSITLDKTSATITLTGEVDLEATIAPANGNPDIEWAATPSAGLTEGVNYDCLGIGNQFTLDMSDSNVVGGTITVTATASGYVDDSSTPDLRAACVVTINAVKSVSLDHDSLSGFTTKSAQIVATQLNFAAPTYLWTVEEESVDGVVSFSSTSVANPTINYLKAGTATIRCTVTDSNSDSEYAECEITVTASEVTSVTWDAADFKLYSGQAITAEMIENWEPQYAMNNLDEDYITENYTIKLGGVNYTLGTPLTVADSGKLVTLTYGGVTTTANNPTVTVVQSLNTIDGYPFYVFNSKTWGSAEGNWTSGKAGNQLTSGRGVQITTGVNGANATSPVSFANVSKVVVTYSTNATAGAGSISIQIGTNDIKSQSVSTTGGTSDRPMTFNFNPTESGNVKLTVACTTNSIYVKSVLIITAIPTKDFANSSSHYDAQAAVVEFAQFMNEKMNGENVCSGTKASMKTAWDLVADKYDDLFGDGTELSETELDYALEMLQNANAEWNEAHDSDPKYCLERAMKTYEFCVANYSGNCSAFMSAVRPLGSNGASIGRLMDSNADSSLPIIIAVIAGTAVLAGGFYLIQRKRKEN